MVWGKLKVTIAKIHMFLVGREYLEARYFELWSSNYVQHSPWSSVLWQTFIFSAFLTIWEGERVGSDRISIFLFSLDKVIWSSFDIYHLCRLHELELESFVKSTQQALRAAEEVGKKSFSAQETTETVLNPAADRTKIVISIQDKAGTKQYRIFAVCSIIFGSLSLEYWTPTVSLFPQFS